MEHFNPPYRNRRTGLNIQAMFLCNNFFHLFAGISRETGWRYWSLKRLNFFTVWPPCKLIISLFFLVGVLRTRLLQKAILTCGEVFVSKDIYIYRIWVRTTTRGTLNKTGFFFAVGEFLLVDVKTLPISSPHSWTENQDGRSAPEAPEVVRAQGHMHPQQTALPQRKSRGPVRTALETLFFLATVRFSRKLTTPPQVLELQVHTPKQLQRVAAVAPKGDRDGGFEVAVCREPCARCYLGWCLFARLFPLVSTFKGAVSRYSVIFCAFLREQKMAVARASVADIRPDQSLAVRAAWQPGHQRWLLTWQCREPDKSSESCTASLVDGDRQHFCFQATRPEQGDIPFFKVQD